MTERIDLDQLTHYSDALAAMVAQLQSGKVIAVPDETGMMLVALPNEGDACQRLADIRESVATGIEVTALADRAVLNDYVDQLSPLTRKLIYRCWPGPVCFRLGGHQPEGFAQDWLALAQSWSQGPTGRTYTVPGQTFAYALLRRLRSPALGLVLSLQDFEAIDLKLLDGCVTASEGRYEEGLSVIRVDEKNLEFERHGVVSETVVSRLCGDVFLFVCTGNTCRSPMAEAIFRRLLAEKLDCRDDEVLDRGYTVLSAGLAAYPGAPASREAVDLLDHSGMDLSSHESQPVTEELLFHSDHIITMTRNHLDAIVNSFPELAGKVRLLSSKGSDVSDPIGGGREDYRKCREEIETYLRALLENEE